MSLRECGHPWRNNDFDCLDCLREQVIDPMEIALEQIAESDSDCENQQFRLTRFQCAQIARAAINHKRTN